MRKPTLPFLLDEIRKKAIKYDRDEPIEEAASIAAELKIMGLLHDQIAETATTLFVELRDRLVNAEDEYMAHVINRIRTLDAMYPLN